MTRALPPDDGAGRSGDRTENSADACDGLLPHLLVLVEAKRSDDV